MVYLQHTGERSAILDGSPGKEKNTMAVPKANQRAVNKYKKNNYDRIEITVPKGRRAVFQAHAAALGESVNGFIGRAILETMERDGGGTAAPGSAPAERVLAEMPAGATRGTRVISLPSEAMEAAQRAAERTGETVAAFVARAVADQEKRDDRSFKMGINPA